jgi:transcriptional regulator with XRE-family HTH domain
MNKVEKKEPLCETSEPCRPFLSESDLEWMRVDVGRRIAEAFDHQSDREIACILKTSCKTVSAFIAGDEFPSVEMLLLIYRVTGVSIDWLLTGEGMKSNAPPSVVYAPEEWVSLGLA